MSPAHLEFKLYSENQDFLAQGKTESNSRSQTLIYYAEDNRWWIKVAVIGTIANLLDNGQIQQASKRQRRMLFQDLVRRINYEPLPLIADTVTELILEGDTAATGQNPAVGLVGTSGTMEILNISLKYKIREDPLRVVYPASADYPCFRKIHDEELTRDTEISDGVLRVYHNGVRYILKIVNRPLYEPRDTSVFRKELENLQYFAGVPNSVQAEGVAVSTNPYMTSSGSDGPLVVTGILLRACSEGSLREVLAENRVAQYAWKKWPVQIGTALNRFHEAKKTHMDMKPSNIVIDGGGNAVVIDISGIGGITREWCSPEIQDEASPFDLSFEQRRLNDIWAYGKLLSEIVLHVRDGPFVNSLKHVAECLMEDNLKSRMSLPEGISRLQGTDR
ncbi:kinase-like domain-containing protein [Aspergillus coremiiformis]|uniref:Kinase-like domain-containing protein n=1 Tax=Aspergillus coremiiformis TaxID=138285 RepID=A0A5N6ZGE1_9EURO|nr:kinase-like domain-containing protein [Aspergillus coremiiformis]